MIGLPGSSAGLIDDEALSAVARLHIASITEGFLSTLGERFLVRLYSAISDAPDAFLVVEIQEGRVVGFASGALTMRSILFRLLCRPFGLVVSLLPFLVRPSQILKILEVIRYSHAGKVNMDLPGAELLSIAVEEGFRGRGIASKLFQEASREFNRRGIVNFRITVGEALLAAHAFYRRMGADPVARTEIHKGQGSTVYVFDVNGGVAGGGRSI